MNTDRKYKFIIIDDHPFIRDGVINYIKDYNEFEFIGEFGDTRSVINSNFIHKPDIIILDLNLPSMDGEKSCPLLKRKFPDCKIIAFTLYEGRSTELEKLGFDGYIIKSEKDSLIEAMTIVLNGKKYFKHETKATQNGSQKFDALDDYLKVKDLTPREIEVARYLTEDFSNREIGEKLIISESTVETHRKHIKEKLGAKSKRELHTILKKYLS